MPHSILVVEDDSEALKAMSRILSFLEHECDAVLSAAHALEKLTHPSGKANYDLVITDVYMPKTSGGELARQIRARHPKLPIILMSGNEDEAREASAGLSHCQTLAKPFQIPTLSNAIAAALRGGG